MDTFGSRRSKLPLPGVLRRLGLSFRHVILGVTAFIILFTLYHFSSPEDSSLNTSGQGPIWPVKTATSGIHEDTVDWPQRAEDVKQAFLHAYHGYEKYAFPKDDLRPIAKVGVNDFNGWGVTMYDSLSTMLLMGLHDEFARALPLIEQQNFSMQPPPPSVIPGRPTPPVYVPFFETVIRYLGGLLSAYALSREPILLERADDLGTKLSGAFEERSHLPAYSVNTETGNSSIRRITILAEIASCQLEYSYLAKMTGKKEHYDRSAKIMEVLGKKNVMKTYGMLPTKWNLITGEPFNEQLSVGGAADSGHEYLLKLYLLTGKSDKASLNLYIQTSNTILSTLLYVSPIRGLLYVTDVFPIPKPSHKFEHLSCFLPGLLAVGAHTLPDHTFEGEWPTTSVRFKDADELRHYNWKELHMLAAQGLAESCYQMYEDQPTGLGPDEVKFKSGELWVRKMKQWRESGRKGTPPGIGAKKKNEVQGGATDYYMRSPKYLLRPETLESIYLMWRTTGDSVWRERGWRIFQALEKEAKSGIAYTSLLSVGVSHGARSDDMPSYFLAETLKYLYLLFREDDLVPLDQWVFNTEAHPLPVFEWSAWERHKFGIS